MQLIMQSPLITCIIISLMAGCTRKLQGDLIIKNVAVINVITGSVSENMDIVIIKDSISNIIPHTKNTSYLANEVVDGKAQYIIAGLWDMHTHTW